MMANLCAEVRHLVRSGRMLDDVVSRVNRQIYDADLPGRFVTFVLATLDATEHRLTVVNAGHMAPLIRRADGTLEMIGEDDAGIPLGIERTRAYQTATTILWPGDVVVLYTDGVTEAIGEKEEFFGAQRLVKAVGSAPGGPQRVGEAVLRALRAFVGNRAQSDDIALVCFERE
jgi:serine phosphatase RsbU (regulator of sigma subunit)